MKITAAKILILGGIAGPVLFTLVTIICAALRPGYNHLYDFISELGASGTPNAVLMNSLGFIPGGLMFSLFGLGLLLSGYQGGKFKAGSVLIIVFGLGVATAGIFSCDVGCPINGTTEAVVHDRVSLVAFFSSITAMFLFGSSFKKTTSFHNLALYSKLSGAFTLLFLVIMILSYPSETLSGLWQRLMLGTIFLWSGVVAYRFALNRNLV